MGIEFYKKKNWFINRFTRGVFFLLGDTIALLISAAISYSILLPFISVEKPFPLEHTLILTASVLMGLVVFRMYVVKWRYMSLRDLVRIILGIVVGGICSLGIAELFFEIGNYEGAFTALFMINAVIAVGGFRISKRLYYGLIKSLGKKKKHTIIFGGESEGEQILRDILNNEQRNLKVKGIFDDRLMSGLLLHGVRIMGGPDKMIDYIRNHPVDQLIVAYPEYPKKELKDIIDEVKEMRPDMDIKILPSFHSLTDDPVGVKNIRDISIEDILGRDPVKIDMESIQASIEDKIVLITGAGGSIGSEIVRQCANLNPDKLIALDIDETELFHIQNEFKNSETEVIPYVASVTDEHKIKHILRRLQPDVIFHAAAYKHVPMMESFPEEAIKVNIGGTRKMALLANKFKVDKFILISTDKAVRPTSVMGATKRVAEEVCMAHNGNCKTKFISVRFGNVLGSRGSVVPLFIEQIKNGGPLTVTHPQMKRYFMTIPEAVLLVMQAGAMGEGGEVFVLDMGEPVKILDMAEDLIRLHSLEPYRDIPIEITGKRPGEKLFEELLNAEEGIIDTEHNEIYKAICSREMTSEELKTRIDHLFDALSKENLESFRYLLKKIVPTYSYQQEGRKAVRAEPPKQDETVLINKWNI
jgi:FlaA1/EpsC-like NDP-sugar epimerase